MSSQPVTYVGKKTTGHGPYKPRATKPSVAGGNEKQVNVNNQLVNTEGSKWEPHGTPPNNTHAREDNQTTSPRAGATVFVNGKAIARIGDGVDNDSDTIAGGSENVFAGDNNGPEAVSPSFIAMTEGDDHDADEPGTAGAYVAAQVAAGNVSARDLAKAADVVPSASDTTPANPPAALSSDCSDIASLTPFPTGDAIDSIVLTERYTVGNLTRTPNVTFNYPLRAPTVGLGVEEIVCNLKLLAVNCLEPIKSKYPNAFITNTYRQPSGNPSSQHPKGMAADIQFRGVQKSEYYIIAQWIKENVTYDQLLLEYKTTGTGLPWIHISFNKVNTRKQVLTMLNDRTYSQGLTQLG